MTVVFRWDPKKASANKKKHGVSFDEAATIFSNVPLQVFHDPDHSDDEEDRYIAVGYSEHQRILLVVHCENSDGSIVRIISARRATATERRAAFGGV